MTSTDPAMCLIKAPSGEANYLLEIRQFLWNHRSEKETDLVIISGKASVNVHQAIILPLSDHPIDLFPPSCPCTKPALCLPPFPNHILTAAIEILYTGKTIGVASQENHVKIKEVFSFLKIKADIIAGDSEGGNIGGEHDRGALAGGVIVKIELTDTENNNSIMILGQDDQQQVDQSCCINDVKGFIDNDSMRNISEMDKRDEQSSSSSSYLDEVTGLVHYHENQNDKNVEGQHSSSSGYLDEFSNFISLNSGSRSSFTIPTGASGLELTQDVGSNYNTQKIVSPTCNAEKVVKTTVRHDTDEIWNDLNRTNETEGYNFRPIKEEPTSPHSKGPLAKLRPRKRNAKEMDVAGVRLDDKNILSALKGKPGNKKQKINTTTESSKKYPCCKCNYETNDKSNFQRHIDSVHQKVSLTLSCNQCDFQTKHKAYLQKHIDGVHDKKIYYCEQCEYKTTRQRHLKVHNDSVHENIFHHCDHCGYKTPWKQNLKKHIESIHEKISYECDDCGYKTTRKECLKMHIKSVHENIFHNCDQCDYKSPWKHNLKTHIEIVHEKISYECDECEYKSTQKFRLKEHIECVHEKNIFHHCDRCDYEKNIFHHCDRCDYKTTWKRNLKTHIESVHEKISYECNDCGYKTTRKYCLKMHIKSKHAGVSNYAYQGTTKAVNKTFPGEFPFHEEPSSNFQIRTPNLSQDQVVDVSSKSTNSDDHGPVNEELTKED